MGSMGLPLAIVVLSVAFISLVFGLFVVSRRKGSTLRPNLSEEKIAENKLMWTNEELQ